MRALLGDLLEARRDVHGVADDGVLEAILGADGAGDDRAAGEADALRQRRRFSSSVCTRPQNDSMTALS